MIRNFRVCICYDPRGFCHALAQKRGIRSWVGGDKDPWGWRIHRYKHEIGDFPVQTAIYERHSERWTTPHPMDDLTIFQRPFSAPWVILLIQDVEHPDSYIESRCKVKSPILPLASFVDSASPLRPYVTRAQSIETFPEVLLVLDRYKSRNQNICRT